MADDSQAAQTAKMAEAVTLGVAFADAGVPDTPANRARWRRMSEELAQAQAEGQIVAAPPE